MRVNAFEPTAAEIGDPMAKLAQVIAFRKSLKAPPPRTAPQVVVTIDPPPARKREPEIINGSEPHRDVNRPEFVDGLKIPYSSHAYLPPGGDWFNIQIKEPAQKFATAAQCIAYICRTEQITYGEIVGTLRPRYIADARHRAIWLTRKYGEPDKCTFPALGRRFGGRDHTTTLNSWRKMESRVKSGEWVPPTFEEITGHERAALCAEAVG